MVGAGRCSTQLKKHNAMQQSGWEQNGLALQHFFNARRRCCCICGGLWWRIGQFYSSFASCCFRHLVVYWRKPPLLLLLMMTMTTRAPLYIDRKYREEVYVLTAMGEKAIQRGTGHLTPFETSHGTQTSFCRMPRVQRTGSDTDSRRAWRQRGQTPR